MKELILFERSNHVKLCISSPLITNLKLEININELVSKTKLTVIKIIEIDSKKSWFLRPKNK